MRKMYNRKKGRKIKKRRGFNMDCIFMAVVVVWIRGMGLISGMQYGDMVAVDVPLSLWYYREHGK